MDTNQTAAQAKNQGNRTVGVIFTLGFIVGAIFNSSGLMGFVGGFLGGVIVAKAYSVELPTEWTAINDEQRGYISIFLNKIQGTINPEKL